jgi:hypothetical protein
MIKRTLHAKNDIRKYHTIQPTCLGDLNPLVANPPNIHHIETAGLSRLEYDGNWLFITISLDPRIYVGSDKKHLKRYINSSYDVQLETCLRYFESVYTPYLRGFSFGSWELDSHGKLHVHVLHHSEDEIQDTYVLNTIRQGVRSDMITQTMTKGKMDYCNSIVQCPDPSETLKYLCKDIDKKKGYGLPLAPYFFYNLI